VRVGREHVAAETNLLDLSLRRQPPAAEAVHAQHRSGAAHVAERLLHLVGIVGQLVDLRLAEHGGERVAARIAGPLARVAPDLDRLGELRNRQFHLAAVVAGADAEVAYVGRLEAGRLHVDRVAARLERREQRVAARAGVDGRRSALRAGALGLRLSALDRGRWNPEALHGSNGHASAHDHRAAGIGDRDPERRVGPRLRRRRDR
jgi:hypothetical protein